MNDRNSTTNEFPDFCIFYFFLILNISVPNNIN
jgi:hypothetical protein